MGMKALDLIVAGGPAGIGFEGAGRWRLAGKGRPAQLQIDAQMVRLISAIARHLTRQGMMRWRSHSLISGPKVGLRSSQR